MMDKILSNANLKRAALKVRENNGAAGVDGMEARELMPYLNTNREGIKAALRNGSYRPSPVRRVEIPKSDGKKRKLGIPTVVDRVIQQAILQILQPIYEPCFSESSYGYRPKRSARDAVLKCRSYLNDGYIWAVDLDIENFFDTVNQRKIMELLSETIRDDRLLSLIWKTMRAGAMRRRKFEKTPRGIPQGNPLSTLLANILLDRLDKELERLGQKFARYADDMVILCKSKKDAKHILRHVAGFLENELQLHVNWAKTAVVYANKIQFLGYGFYKSGGEYRLRVHPKALRRMTAKFDALLEGSGGKDGIEWKQKLKRYIEGWVRFYRLADLENTLKMADKAMQKKIRGRVQTLWEEALAELQTRGETKMRRAAFPLGTSPAIRPQLSKRQLENKGFPGFSAHYAAIAG